MKKRNLFETLPPEALLKLNSISLIITLLCEVFVVYTFLTKGQQDNLEPWKYAAILGGLILVSLLFAGSVLSFLFFLKARKKRKTQKTGTDS
ncbi:MAG TPA: hypothetical protein PLK12_09250 [Prolixibacteraceae bacterium]|nr:hypothetical protein [Prolixibacteraceae bacterium]